jgi:hypothetical protein
MFNGEYPVTVDVQVEFVWQDLNRITSAKQIP